MNMIYKIHPQTNTVQAFSGFIGGDIELWADATQPEIDAYLQTLYNEKVAMIQRKLKDCVKSQYKKFNNRNYIFKFSFNGNDYQFMIDSAEATEIFCLQAKKKLEDKNFYSSTAGNLLNTVYKDPNRIYYIYIAPHTDYTIKNIIFIANKKQETINFFQGCINKIDSDKPTNNIDYVNYVNQYIPIENNALNITGSTLEEYEQNVENWILSAQNAIQPIEFIIPANIIQDVLLCEFGF